MKNITIKQLKEILETKKYKNYKIIKPNKLIITFFNGNKYILNGINIIKRGSHLIIKKDNEIITLSSVFQKITYNLIFSILGLIISIVASLISTVFFINKPVAPIQERIKELKKIQTSLTLLTNYVNNQQIKLEELDKTINSLQEQKKEIENIISLDKEKVEDLLQYQKIQNIRDKWIERIISFFIGIFSSLSATFFYILIKQKIRNYKVEKIE